MSNMKRQLEHHVTGCHAAICPESRRASAAGQRPTAPRAGAPQRWTRESPPAERHHKSPTATVATPPRGRALPSVGFCASVVCLTLLLLGLARPAAADFLGIPLARQPFVKVCPDGTIVGSFGPYIGGEPPKTIGASIYDPRTGTTTFIRRDAPDFVERLAANPCVQKPIGRDAMR